jgi:hypothetical protein
MGLKSICSCFRAKREQKVPKRRKTTDRETAPNGTNRAEQDCFVAAFFLFFFLRDPRVGERKKQSGGKRRTPKTISLIPAWGTP